MSDKNFQMGASPRLSFHACAGDLRIQSWDREEVQVHFREGEAAQAQEVEGELRIANAMPEAVNVPPGASVLIQGCVGDVRATNLAALRIEQHQGDLSLHQVSQVELTTVHGDVEAREARSLQVATLHGDLRAQAIAESLAISAVHGDIELKEAQGQLALQDITGDVVIREPAGHLDMRNVTGDVVLSGNLQTGDYHLEALGDVVLRLGTASNVQVELEARLGRIAYDLALTEITESAHKLSGKMGQGTARVQVVTLGGDIRLRALGADQLRHEMERERIRAQAHAQREAARAERQAERAEGRAARARRWQVQWSTPRPGYSAPLRQETMSPEKLQDERLAVLKMLAEGKINAEQAEGLLDALEG